MQRSEPKTRQLRRQNCTSQFKHSDSASDVQATKKMRSAINPESLTTTDDTPKPKAKTVLRKPAAAKAKQSGRRPVGPPDAQPEVNKDLPLVPPFSITYRKPQLYIQGVQKARNGEASILQGPTGPPPRRRAQTMKNNLCVRRRACYDWFHFRVRFLLPPLQGFRLENSIHFQGFEAKLYIAKHCNAKQSITKQSKAE